MYQPEDAMVLELVKLGSSTYGRSVQKRKEHVREPYLICGVRAR